MRRIPTAIAALALFCGVAFAAEPTGTWLTQSGETKVRISPCGGEFCGDIVWVKGDKTDSNNPDPGLRSRPLTGVRMIYAMKGSGDTYSGKLYNPMDGKTYSGKLKVLGPDTLQLAGCVMGVFCKRQTWTRSE